MAPHPGTKKKRKVLFLYNNLPAGTRHFFSSLPHNSAGATFPVTRRKKGKEKKGVLFEVLISFYWGWKLRFIRATGQRAAGAGEMRCVGV